MGAGESVIEAASTNDTRRFRCAGTMLGPPAVALSATIAPLTEAIVAEVALLVALVAVLVATSLCPTGMKSAVGAVTAAAP